MSKNSDSVQMEGVKIANSSFVLGAAILLVGVLVGYFVLSSQPTSTTKNPDTSVSDTVTEVVATAEGRNYESLSNSFGIDEPGDNGVLHGESYTVGYYFLPGDTFNGQPASNYKVRHCDFGWDNLTNPGISPITPLSGTLGYHSASFPTTGNRFATNGSTVRAGQLTSLRGAYKHNTLYSPSGDFNDHANAQAMTVELEFEIKSNLARNTRFEWTGIECRFEHRNDNSPIHVRVTNPSGSFVGIVNSSPPGSSSSSSSSTSSTATVTVSPTEALFRFYRPSTLGHLYTNRVAERNKMRNQEPFRTLYNYEGEKNQVLPKVLEAPNANAKKVYRAFNKQSKTHRYTIDTNLYNSMNNNSARWLGESYKFHAYATQIGESVPFHEFYNSITGGYFYTSREPERQNVVRNLPQFQYKGISFYVYPKS